MIKDEVHGRGSSREERVQIVYNSFAGRYSDNPRAIYEALRERGSRYTHVWLSDPAHADGFPAGTVTVALAADSATAALESADMVVSNTHIELDWAKRPDAVYLQTWHGTPLKRIHFDMLWAPPGRVARLSRDVRRWDYLLSPNRASTDRLRRAFGFTGEVLETGYPRNDVLSSPKRDGLRAAVRRRLGIADGVTAVLYTPTWRDDILGADGNPDPARAFTLPLDLAEFTGRLAGSHVLLLRLHPLLAGRLDPVHRPGVVDLSFHPEISDLYLAADVMITDYSSTMFDFALTGKPMLFYTYDLDRYRDSLRGFYFNLPACAPGPLLPTTTGVVDALTDLAAVRRDHADRYRQFRQRFGDLDDGNATARVVDRFFA